MHLCVARFHRDLAGNARRNRGVINKHPAPLQRGEDPARAEHAIGQIIVVAHAGDHDIGVFRPVGGAVGHGNRELRMRLAPFVDAGGAAVVEGEVMAGIAKMAGNRPSHHAKANNADAARGAGRSVGGCVGHGADVWTALPRKQRWGRGKVRGGHPLALPLMSALRATSALCPAAKRL